MIYLSGVATDRTAEGSIVVRAAMIISNETEAVIQAIFEELGRGVTILGAKEDIPGDRPIIYVVNRFRSDAPQNDSEGC